MLAELSLVGAAMGAGAKAASMYVRRMRAADAESFLHFFTDAGGSGTVHPLAPLTIPSYGPHTSRYVYGMPVHRLVAEMASGQRRAHVIALTSANTDVSSWGYYPACFAREHITMDVVGFRGFHEGVRLKDPSFLQGGNRRAHALFGIWTKGMTQAVQHLARENSDVPVFLMGASIGGAQSLIALNRSPRLNVAGVIGIAPALVYVTPEESWFIRNVYLPAIVPIKTALGQPRHRKTPEIHESFRLGFRSQVRNRSWASERAAMMVSAEGVKAAESLAERSSHPPALVLLGARDSTVHPRSAEVFGQALPNIAVHTLPNTGHWIQVTPNVHDLDNGFHTILDFVTSHI